MKMSEMLVSREKADQWNQSFFIYFIHTLTRDSSCFTDSLTSPLNRLENQGKENKNQNFQCIQGTDTQMKRQCIVFFMGHITS